MTFPDLRPLLDKVQIRGSLAANAPLADLVWFRAGGPAQLLFQPADEEDLAAFLQALPADVPVTVIGLGSNLIVRDGGFPGPRDLKQKVRDAIDPERDLGHVDRASRNEGIDS